MTKIPSRKFSTAKKKIPSRKFPKSQRKIASRGFAKGSAKIASRGFPKAPAKKTVQVCLDRRTDEQSRLDRVTALRGKAKALLPGSDL
jgi:hypothetical protein